MWCSKCKQAVVEGMDVSSFIHFYSDSSCNFTKIADSPPVSCNTKPWQFINRVVTTSDYSSSRDYIFSGILNSKDKTAILQSLCIILYSRANLMVLMLLLQEVLLFYLLSSLVTSFCAVFLLCVSPQTKLFHSADAAKRHLARKVFFSLWIGFLQFWGHIYLLDSPA